MRCRISGENCVNFRSMATGVVNASMCVTDACMSGDMATAAAAAAGFVIE